MMPSQRIAQLIGKTSNDPEWDSKAIEATIQYLDEQDHDQTMSEPCRKARSVGLLTGLLWFFESDGKLQFSRTGAAKIIHEVITLIDYKKADEEKEPKEVQS